MSREIDALIAEHPFGLRVIEEEAECSASAPGAYWVGQAYCAVTIHYVVPSGLPEEQVNDYIVDNPDDCDLPPYSTDIAAAWQVVGEMRKRGWVELHLTQYTDGSVRAAFIGDDKPSSIAYGERDAEAICLAALRALGISPETSKEG